MYLASCLLCAMVVTAQASAPSPTHRLYVYGSGLISSHPGNGERYLRVADNLGGTVFAVAGGIGAFVTPKVGLEGEVVVGGLVSAPQRFSYLQSVDYVAQNRDILFNALVRFRSGERHAVDFVLGGGLARTTARQLSQVETEPGYPPQPLPDQSHTLNALTLTGGVDVALPVSPRVSIAPSFRLRWVQRPGIADWGWNGIGPLAYQFGASVQFR